VAATSFILLMADDLGRDPPPPPSLSLSLSLSLSRRRRRPHPPFPHAAPHIAASGPPSTHTGDRLRLILSRLSCRAGAGDPHYANSRSPISTPELDKMAAAPHTLVLDRFYAGGPSCAPTRASVLLGRTPHRDWECFFRVDAQHLDHDAWTLAKVARQAGLKAALFGKWHLGSLQITPDGSCKSRVRRQCMAFSTCPTPGSTPDMPASGHGTPLCSAG
jgi:hypothetical protein